MSKPDENSEKQRRRVSVPIPASVAAFSRVAGVGADEVIQELGKMGIHARGDFIIPKEALQVIGRKHGVEVEFHPPPHV